MIDEYRYQPTELEEELFLSDVPYELIEQSIQTQFNEPLEYRKKDYIQSFIMKYNFSKDNFLEDDALMLDVYHEKFLKFIEDTFMEYLGVGFTDIDSIDEDEAHELIHLTYRFFIKNIKKNFVNIVYNYVTDNKDKITSMCSRKKDVTANNFKTEIDDEYDILVLSNLSDIIHFIIDDVKTLNDVNAFFNLCVSDEPILELEYVQNAYTEFELTGNFIEKYLNMINDDFMIEIQSKMRNKILKKYPKRVRKMDVVDDDDLLDYEYETNEEPFIDTEVIN